MWKPAVEPPVIYQTATGLTQDNNHRYEYQRRLGYEYGELLASKGIAIDNIPIGENRELYFLFTFRESNYAFLILDKGTIAWYDNDTLAKRIDDIFLMLPIPSKSKIHITLNTIPKTHRFELEITSFNHVDLHPIPFHK